MDNRLKIYFVSYSGNEGVVVAENEKKALLRLGCKNPSDADVSLLGETTPNCTDKDFIYDLKSLAKKIIILQKSMEGYSLAAITSINVSPSDEE